MGYLFNAEVFLGGGEISVDLSQKGGTQKRLGTTDLKVTKCRRGGIDYSIN